jgi:hypothetical protein
MNEPQQKTNNDDITLEDVIGAGKKIAKSNYNVQIESDNLDQFYADGTYSNDPTCGRLTLDGVEVRWSLGPVNNCWAVTDENNTWGDRFDLLINDTRDFRSRANAGDIYDAVVTALQWRHHPDHCDCDPCEERHRRSVAGIVGELRQEGLTVEPADGDGALRDLGL